MMDSDIDLDHPKNSEVAMTGLWKVALADKERDSTDPSIKLELDLTYDREEKLR